MWFKRKVNNYPFVVFPSTKFEINLYTALCNADNHTFFYVCILHFSTSQLSEAQEEAKYPMSHSGFRKDTCLQRVPKRSHVDMNYMVLEVFNARSDFKWA